MSRRVSSRVLALAVVLGAAAPARASVAIALDVEELARRADVVVIGEVVSAAAEPARGMIVTRVVVRITEAVDGGAAVDDEVEVLVPGGELHGVGQLVHGAPRLEPGGRYLLFLEGVTGGYRVVGMAQGALPVADDGGEAIVSPPADLPGLVRSVGGRLVEAEPAVPAPTPLVGLVPRIREARRAGR